MLTCWAAPLFISVDCSDYSLLVGGSLTTAAEVRKGYVNAVKVGDLAAGGDGLVNSVPLKRSLRSIPNVVNQSETLSARNNHKHNVPPSFCPKQYKDKTFSTEAFSELSFDTKRSFSPGYNWYLWNWFSGRNPKDTVSIDENGVAFAKGVSGPNGTISTASQSPTFPYFVGTAFGGGFCVEAEIKFDYPNQPSAVGWPSFWGMSLEHLVGSKGRSGLGDSEDFEHFVEVDIAEFYKVPRPGYLSSIIEWFGKYKTTCYPDPFCKIAKSSRNKKDVFRKSIDWSKGHKIGAVWVPATHKSYGSMSFYFDGNLVAKPFLWRKNNQGRSTKAEVLYDYSIVDKHHLVLFFGSNANPIGVKSIVVYQKDGNSNRVN